MAVSFKVGDRVELRKKSEWTDKSNMRVGNIYVVSEISTDTIDPGLRVSVKCNRGLESFWLKTDQFILYSGPHFSGTTTTPKYKKGDELRLKNEFTTHMPVHIILKDYYHEVWGTVSTGRFTESMLDDYYVKVGDVMGTTGGGIVEYRPSHYKMLSPYEETIFNKIKDKIKDKTMNLIKLAKDLTLSADEKLLRKVGLKTECGDYTQEAISIVLQKLCEDNKEYLLKLAADAEKENK